MTENELSSGNDLPFAPEAYNLVLEALGATVKLVKAGKIKPACTYSGERSIKKNPATFHVSGRELLEGFRIHVISQFGRMSLFMLNRWGIRTTEDVGRIVFKMVEDGRMSRRESDTLDDFRDGYDFEKAFGEFEE